MAEKNNNRPVDRFENIIESFMSWAAICGANILSKDYRMTYLTWFVIGLINSYYGFTIYTIYEGVVIRSDYTVILQSLCLCGAAIQGFAKLISAILHGPQLRFIRAEFKQIYKVYEEKHEAYGIQLRHSLHVSKRIIYSLFALYAFTTVMVISLPFYYFIVLKQRIFVMQFIIPGISQTTFWGYIIHQIVHISCICFGSFGNYASDAMLFVLTIHIPLAKNILQCKFDDLNRLLEKHPHEEGKATLLLKDIFVWHQRYINIANTLTTCFFWVIFVEMGTLTTSIISTIVCLFLGTWPAGPLFLIYSLVVMYIYCGLGDLVDTANSDISIIIYDSMWYSLPVSEQKMVMLMLRNSQQTTAMSVGGVMPLSLNTALKLTKTIYSVAMLLNEFLN